VGEVLGEPKKLFAHIAHALPLSVYKANTSFWNIRKQVRTQQDTSSKPAKGKRGNKKGKNPNPNYLGYHVDTNNAKNDLGTRIIANDKGSMFDGDSVNGSKPVRTSAWMSVQVLRLWCILEGDVCGISLGQVSQLLLDC
jgi:hypothetical protein